jgi:glycine/serine hydroxymethyltransferase
MARIGDFIARVLASRDEETVGAVATEVRELTENFPLYISAATT